MMLLERLGIVVLTFVLIYLYQAFPCRLTAFCPYGRANVIVGILVSGYV